MLELLLLALPSVLQAPVLEGAPRHYELGPDAALVVLYAGAPGEAREAAFLEFLGRAFERVDAIDLRELNSESAAPYDVVVADWRPSYVDGEWNQGEHHGAKLEADFATPILMVGDLAGELPSTGKFRHL